MDSHVDPTALLMPRPRTLYQLWDEYIRGIGNNKPAKYFTRAERGKFKFKYSRRKVLWDLIEQMNRAGISSSEAITRIHSHYGNGSPTSIIDSIRKDRKNHTMPLSLRV